MRADEGRQLRIDFGGQPGMAGAEPRELPEAPTHARGTEEDEPDAMQVGDTEDLLERICSRENMQAACDRVVRNGGAGGVDGMGVAELPAWLDANHDALTDRILRGRGARSGCSASPPASTGWSSRPSHGSWRPYSSRGSTGTATASAPAGRLTTRCAPSSATPTRAACGWRRWT